MSAVETALVVVDGSGIVEVGTDNAMELAAAAGNAKIVFINKRDKDNIIDKPKAAILLNLIMSIPAFPKINVTFFVTQGIV